MWLVPQNDSPNLPLGELSHTFLFSKNTPEIPCETTVILSQYPPWFALNFVIVWLFAIIALQWPVYNQRVFSRQSERLTSSDLLGLMPPYQNLDVHRSVNFYKGSKVWTILECMGALVSITHDILMS